MPEKEDNMEKYKGYHACSLLLALISHHNAPQHGHFPNHILKHHYTQ